MNRLLAFLALCALAGLVAAPAHAQYALRASVVAAGATDASGGAFRLRGTVGEPAVGRVAGGAFAVGQGFWYPATAGGGPPSGPLVDVTLTPTDPPPPVMIRRGETLRYRAEFAIATNGPSSFQYWAEATLPNNQVQFLFGPVTVNGTPGTTVVRNLQQRVPTNVPLGNYVFRMKVGTFPGTVYDEDSFPLQIIAGEALATRSAGQPVTRGTGQPATRSAGEAAVHTTGRDAEAAERQAAGRSAAAGRTAAARPAAARVAAAEVAVPLDVPAEVARRIAEAPLEWWAWDEDGTILEAGLVQDLRLEVALERARREATEDAAREAAEEEERATREAAGAAETAPAPLASTHEAPTATALAPAFPNPFDARTTLRFGLPEAGPARLAVYDVRGRRLALLADGEHAAGWHEASFDGSGLAGGVYVVRLEAAGRVLTQRLTLVR